MTLTYWEAMTERVNADDRLQLSGYEKDAVAFTLYALQAFENGDYETAALYLAKAEIVRRA